MKDLPIIMSAPMILATLREVEEAGTGKQMTRRYAFRRARKNECRPHEDPATMWAGSSWMNVEVGDRLWVRENFWRYGRWVPTKKGGKVSYSFQPLPWAGKGAVGLPGTPRGLLFAADDNTNFMPLVSERGKFAQVEPAWHLRPNIFLERAHSRLTLIVTGTKIERLWDISEQDCEREGLRWDQASKLWACPAPGGGEWHAVSTAKECFMWLWVKLHSRESWDANPEVCAISYRPVLANIDTIEARAA